MGGETEELRSDVDVVDETSPEHVETDEIAKLITRLSRSMRARGAASKQTPSNTEWSYLVACTIDEMEAEAAREQRLLELRIALLQCQPSCRAMLAELRRAAFEAPADQALTLLKYAVAWRAVFGSERANVLRAILALAAKGTTLRNAVDGSGHEVIYLATADRLERARWNTRGTSLEIAGELVEDLAHSQVSA